MDYNHTQRAPIHLFLLVPGLAMLLVACAISQEVARISLFAGSGLMLLFSFSFRCLSVRDEGDQLRIWFGPLPLFQRRLAYSEINAVERSRTALIEGLGIHLSLGGGWVWNIWGRDCVDVLYGSKGRIRIGTDDAEALERFLRKRIEG